MSLWCYGLFFKTMMTWTYESLFSNYLVQEGRKGTLLKPVPGAMFGLFWWETRSPATIIPGAGPVLGRVRYIQTPEKPSRIHITSSSCWTQLDCACLGEKEP